MTGTPLSVNAITLPDNTLGEGDQTYMSQQADGTFIGMINDGRGWWEQFDNGYNRETSNIENAGNGWPHGPKYNHMLSVLTGVTPGALSPWTASFIPGYDNRPADDEAAFYAFAHLCVDNDIIFPLALSQDRHSGNSYRGSSAKAWGGNAFCIREDGTWRYRTSTNQASINWGAALPTNECTLIPANMPDWNGTRSPAMGDYSPFTMACFVQMGQGYADNVDADPDYSRGIRGYVFIAAPNGHVDEHADQGNNRQKQIVLARCWINEGGSRDLTRVFNPANWSYWTGSGWSTNIGARSPIYTVNYGRGTQTGQAYYPHIVYVKSQDSYLAISSTLQDADNSPSTMFVHGAKNLTGPWTEIYRWQGVFLQGNSADRLFSPSWFMGFTDIDAGTDGSGNPIRRFNWLSSGLGPVPPWNQTNKRRYGVNDGGVLDVVFEATATGPVANDDTGIVADGDTILIDVLANDVGTGLSIQSVGLASHGDATIQSGQVQYVHTQGANVGGTDIFNYTIVDGDTNTDTGQITVTITAQPGDLPVLANVTTNPSTSRSTSKTGTIPAGTVEGDLLVLIADGNNTGTTTPASGWTVLHQPRFVGGYPEEYIWVDEAWKIATASDTPGSVVSWGSPNCVGNVTIYRITGADAINPIEPVTASNSATGRTGSATCPVITTQGDNRLILRMVGLSTGTEPSVPPSAAQTYWANSTSSPDFHSAKGAQNDQITQGSTPADAWDLNLGGQTRPWLATTIAVVPSASTGPAYDDAAGRINTTVEGLKVAALAGPQGSMYEGSFKVMPGSATFAIRLGEATPPAPVSVSWASGDPSARVGGFSVGQGLNDDGTLAGDAQIDIEELIVVAGTVSAEDEQLIIDWLRRDIVETGAAFTDGTLYTDGTGHIF